MGSGGYSPPTSRNYYEQGTNLPVHLREIGKECSVVAVSKLFDLKVSDVLVKIRDTKKEHLFLGTGGVTKDSVLDMLKVYGINKIDMRLFNNKYRINTTHIPFPIKSKGIVALKFKRSMNTHWVAYFEGKIKDDDSTLSSMSDIRSKHALFDGFGHCILTHTDESENVFLESVYSKGCSSTSMCNKCVREKYCFEKPRTVKTGERPRRYLDQ